MKFVATMILAVLALAAMAQESEARLFHRCRGGLVARVLDRICCVKACVKKCGAPQATPAKKG